MINGWTAISPVPGRRRDRRPGVQTPRSRDEDELDVAAARLPCPRLSDAIERHRFGVEADRARARVPDELGVALREQVERDGEVRVAEETQLLSPDDAGGDRGV